MHRRHFLAAGLGAATLAATARSGWAQSGFTSQRISVVTRGAGPDVVLIPGLASSRDVWRATTEQLATTHRLHLVQLTGFSEPTPQPDGPVFEPVAQDILRYIRETRLAKPALIGHSMGGALSLRMAAAAPDAVGRAMVVDALPFFSVLINPAATADTAAPMAAMTAAQMQAMTPELFAAQQARSMATLIKTESARGEAVAWSVASDRGTVARAMRDVMTTDLRPQLPQITAPVTVLYAWDGLMPFPQAGMDAFYAQNYAALKGVKLVRVDDSFHFIMTDQKARFAAEVATFLG